VYRNELKTTYQCAKLLTALNEDKMKKQNNMKQIYKTIDYEWLDRPTGDAFANSS